jgi:hypothetical protein
MSSPFFELSFGALNGSSVGISTRRFGGGSDVVLLHIAYSVPIGMALQYNAVAVCITANMILGSSGCR